ncbi:hypothetical protein CkaCkLH20_01419 [Colletotrichum karsti]|uniref:Heme-binding protein HMX1 n=1 Tax=Colletotrichum karsti TaxID=1095194 RepID=A0A9P6IEA9_9PEZI|nr:uncharacterized protein CkaCkLH20_01419 [Colletotrichum karsti]KAF9881269.1 hypothetical protein CkaCkLH20_01419 [Colletotrichum karsti]
MTSAAAPPPPPEDVQRPLSESIAAATRSVHTKLNRLIIARLPLAIPPRSADPAIYVSGLLHIAPIYIAFESLLKDIVDSSAAAKYDSAQGTSEVPSTVSNAETRLKNNVAITERTRSILESIYLPGLMRSDRLRSDIRSLTGWSPEVVEEQLRIVSESSRLAEFVRHVKRTIERKPHVLLAYSYILFMALFAGGRFIRATLESAGSDFWDQVPSPIPPSQQACQPRPQKKHEARAPVDLFGGDSGTLEIGEKHLRHTFPLSFFHFATALDGEDLKKEFKRRLAESEGLLTAQEHHDVIQEAICIFDNMLLLVSQLDNVCETDFEDDKAMSSWISLGSGGRLRDSVVVTHERRAQASQRGSEDSERSNTWLCKHARQKRSETSAAPVPIDLEGQPPACCPASGSMKFDGKLPVPDRKGQGAFSTDGAADMPPSTRQARSFIALLSNIVLIAGLAAIVGMFCLARRS